MEYTRHFKRVLHNLGKNMSQPKCFVIAGPNGAGKSTFAATHLKEKLQLYQFINADLIAEGLFPFNEEKHSLEASKLF
jgi:predicted ABC-type ATPase